MNDLDKKYLLNYSDKRPIVFDRESRSRKAEKINAIIRDYFKGNTGDKSVLDIGCSTGIIDRCLAPRFRNIVGIDVDAAGMRYAAANAGHHRLQYIFADGCHPPFKNHAFDIVLCNIVYPYVPDANELIMNIHDLLKDNGVCYFAAPNRLMVCEGRYRIPLLTWLPHSIANVITRACYNLDMKERYLGLFGLRKLVKDYIIYDYTIKIFKDPDTFSNDICAIRNRYMRLLLVFLLRIFYVFIPTYIWVLRKRD